MEIGFRVWVHLEKKRHPRAWCRRAWERQKVCRIAVGPLQLGAEEEALTRMEGQEWGKEDELKGRWGQVKALRLYPRGNKEPPQITAKAVRWSKSCLIWCGLQGFWGERSLETTPSRGSWGACSKPLFQLGDPIQPQTSSSLGPWKGNLALWGFLLRRACLPFPVTHPGGVSSKQKVITDRKRGQTFFPPQASWAPRQQHRTAKE